VLGPAASPHAYEEPAPLQELLPRVGDHVHLLLGQVRVDARVHAALPGRLDLAARAAPLDLARASGLTAQLHSSHESGVCRLLGRLGMPAGFVVQFTYAGTPQLLLRREHVRADLCAPIDFELARGVASTSTINLSASGLLVAGPLPVRAGQLVPVSLCLPGARSPVRAIARVVRVTPERDVALALADVSPADRARLTLAVFEERRRPTTGRA